MAHIKHWKNGKLDWEIKIEAIVVGVLALLVLALLTDANAAEWIYRALKLKY